MARIRADYVFGTLGTELGSGDTALASDGLERLPAVSSPDVAAVTIHDGTAYEIVHVTAHTASAVTATILRGQEGTAAQAWDVGASWLHGLTVADVTAIEDGAGMTVLRRAAAQSIPNATFTEVAWDSEDTDPLNAWASGSSITVPAGIAWAKVTAYVCWANNSTGKRYVRMMNSTTGAYLSGDIRDAANESKASIATPWVQVTPGDVLKLLISQDSGAALNLLGTGYGSPTRISVEWRS